MANSGSNNALYLRQQFSALLGNTSSSIKFICISTLVGYALSFSDRAVDILSVTPGYLMPPTFWIWTIFTFCFIELHFWEVLVDLITVGLCGKLIEPSWGQMEMLQYFAITNIGVAILTSFYYLFYSMITKDAEFLFDVHIHGLAGMNAGMSRLGFWIAFRGMATGFIQNFFSCQCGCDTNHAGPFDCSNTIGKIFKQVSTPKLVSCNKG